MEGADRHGVSMTEPRDWRLADWSPGERLQSINNWDPTLEINLMDVLGLLGLLGLLEAAAPISYFLMDKHHLKQEQ